MTRLKPGFRKFVRYIGVALLSAGADWIVFFSLVQTGTNPLLAQAVARISGGGASFFANKVFTFDVKSKLLVGRQARRFLLLYVVSYTLSLFLVWFGITVLKADPYWTKLASDAICFVFNYVVMDLYVFANKSNHGAVESAESKRNFEITTPASSRAAR